MQITRNILACVALGASLAVGAEDLKTEVVVDRQVTPAERAATRLGSVAPDMLGFSVRPVQLSFTEYTAPSQLTPSWVRLDAASWPGLPERTPYRGYASIGYFPIINCGVSAGYRFIDTEKTTLGAWLQFDGVNYHGEKQPGTNSKPKIQDNTVTVGAYLRQRFAAASHLDIGLDYTYAALCSPMYDDSYTQNVNMFDAVAGWKSQVGRLSYSAGVDFGLFSFGKAMPLQAMGANVYADGASDTHFVATLGGRYDINGSSAVAMDVKGDFLHVGGGLQPEAAILSRGQGGVPAWSTLGVVSITPSYTLRYSSVTARIGMKVDLSTGGEGKKFHIAPDVKLGFAPSGQFAVYARVGGGEWQNTLRSLYEYSSFMPSCWAYGRSHIPLTVDAGINVGPFNGVALELFGGYAVANDWLMPQEVQNQLSTIYFSPVDMKGWHLGARVSYSCKTWFKLRASVELAPQDYDKGYYLWRDRAGMVVGAGATVTPVDRLKIDVDYAFRDRRRTYCVGIASIDDPSLAQPLSLGAVSDLSLGASYELSDAVTVFARGENLLGRRYYIFSPLVSEGVHGMIGAALKF